MRPGRWVIILFALAGIALLAAALFALAARGGPPAEPPRAGAERPRLLLLTSLPLIFPERFGLDGGGSKALDALEARYQVVPIAVADAGSLRQGDLLLMAHPLAQPAEVLVALDRWVRGGGHVLLLADPKLDWPSERPLGDLHRPPPSFADTGLLGHWGLRLDSPSEPGPQTRALGERRILTSSPGELYGDCAIGGDRLVARCAIGEGAVTVVADADFLNVDQLDGPTGNNLDALIAELARLEAGDSSESRRQQTYPQ